MWSIHNQEFATLSKVWCWEPVLGITYFLFSFLIKLHQVFNSLIT